VNSDKNFKEIKSEHCSQKSYTTRETLMKTTASKHGHNKMLTLNRKIMENSTHVTPVHCINKVLV
jgi:hypothetical protein